MHPVHAVRSDLRDLLPDKELLRRRGVYDVYTLGSSICVWCICQIYASPSLLNSRQRLARPEKKKKDEKARKKSDRYHQQYGETSCGDAATIQRSKNERSIEVQLQSFRVLPTPAYLGISGEEEWWMLQEKLSPLSRIDDTTVKEPCGGSRINGESKPE